MHEHNHAQYPLGLCLVTQRKHVDAASGMCMPRLELPDTQPPMTRPAIEITSLSDDENRNSNAIQAGQDDGNRNSDQTRITQLQDAAHAAEHKWKEGQDDPATAAMLMLEKNIAIDKWEQALVELTAKFKCIKQQRIVNELRTKVNNQRAKREPIVLSSGDESVSERKI